MKILNLITSEISSYIEYFIINFPGRIGNLLRKLYWKYKLNVGDKLFVGQQTRFFKGNLIHIGSEVQFGTSMVIDASDSNGILIEDNVAIAHGTYIRSANHNFDSLEVSIQSQGHFAKSIEYLGKNYSIIIESDVWIGANVILLSGTHIGTGSIISAGAVISSKIPSYSIVVGNPGRVVGSRKTKHS